MCSGKNELYENYEAEDENTQVPTQREQPRVESEEDTEVVFSQRQQQQQQNPTASDDELEELENNFCQQDRQVIILF